MTNIADYGAFVELEPGVEGLIHVSEMSWTKKNVHPGKIVSTSQQVEVQVLEVDPQQAAHLARPEADPGQPLGGLPRRAPEGLDRRGPDPQHHRVRPLHRPRRRRRRHGAPVRPRLDARRRRGDQGLQEGRQRSKPSCSMSTARRSASRSASSSSPAIRSTRSSSYKKGDAVTCTVRRRPGERASRSRSATAS